MGQDFRPTERREKRLNDRIVSPLSMMQRKLHRKKLMSKKFLIGLMLISSIGLGVGFFHLLHSPVNEANLPVIMEAKEDACIKVRPNAADNTSVPYSNISIYNELEEHSKEPAVEQLLPETEKPTLTATTEPDKIETPTIEVVHLNPNPLEETLALKETKEKLVCQIDAPNDKKESPAARISATEQPTQKVTSKSCGNLNEPQTALRNICNEVHSVSVENMTHDKKMPNIEQSNTKLKTFAPNKPATAKEVVLIAKTNFKANNPVEAKKITPSTIQPQTKPFEKNYWVDFKPVSTSNEAERMWHQLATNKSAKIALVGAQHKVQKQASANGAQGYRLLAGPYTKEEAIACCQKLRKARVNCRVIKK